MEKPMTVAHQHHGLHDYFRILVKRRWAALMIFIIAVTTAAFSSFYTTPIYRATAQILIERQTPRVLDKLDTPTPYDSSKEEFTQTQYKLLGSRALVRKVIDKLELKNHPYYSNIFRGLSPKADEVKKQQVEERLVSAIVGKIMVTPIRRTNLVDISFLHNDPKFSAYLINNLAQCYLEQSLELRFATSQEAARWLDENLTKARKKLEESETALNQYKKEYHIAAVEDKESITTQKLEQLNRDLVTAQTHRMEAETRFNKLSKGQPIPQVINNSLIQTLKAQEAKIIAEVSELGRKYGEEHPRIIQLND